MSEQALDWAVRTGDPDFADWDAFTAWLEADPAHAAAYDRICAGIADAAEALSATPQAANDDAPRPGFTRRWLGGAVAVTLAGVLLLSVWQTGNGRTTHATDLGETLTIALDDGSTVTLDGGSKVLVDEDNPRFARLEEGRALFTVRHDEANPFVVEVGEDRLLDAGTVFDVRTGGGGLIVGVSEGAVIYNPQGADVRLDPGQQLVRLPGSRDITVRPVDLAQVGEWREGRLTFRQAPLSEIAIDLTRATGVSFRAAPGSAARAFSGSVMTRPLREDPATLGPLLGVAIRQEGDGWVIEAP